MESSQRRRVLLRVLGRPSRACDGWTRRNLLSVGGLSLFPTMTLPRLLQAAGGSEASADRPAAAKAVVLVNLFGGPSHIDMFDLKPKAPSNIRGEFKPISTAVPGVQICEHLPRTARRMHDAALIRTVTHGYNSHHPYAVFSGFADGKRGHRNITYISERAKAPEWVADSGKRIREELTTTMDEASQAIWQQVLNREK